MEDKTAMKDYSNLEFMPVQAATSLDNGVYMVSFSKFNVI